MQSTEASASIPLAQPTLFSDLSELVKLRLTTLVVFTAIAGFYAAPVSTQAGLWLHVIIGVFLVAAGAAILNQLLEVVPDRKMKRTADRPLPTCRIEEQDALLLGILCSGGGLLYLAWFTNIAAAATAAVTWLVYLFIYTPMKRWSVSNTLVGAVPGALPPLIGWTAATGRWEAAGWLLFSLVFLWQMPHFLAIAWLYKDDYKRGGFRMLPMIDPNGFWTASSSLFFAALLVLWIPFCIWLDLCGLVALSVIAFATAVYIASAWKFLLNRDNQTARRMFAVSLLYLPLVLIAMLTDKA